MGGMQDDCCGLSRRRILRLSSAAPAGGPASPPPAAGGACAASGTDGSGLYAHDLELVTVTDTSFVLTWYTASAPPPATPYHPDQAPAPATADGLVRYGTSPDRLGLEAREASPDTAYHYVEVTGLRPGTTYYYQASSAGVTAAPRLYPRLTFPPAGLVIQADAQLPLVLAGLLASGDVLSASPGSVTTLVPPPGELLLTIALSNDLHVGETVSGLATADFPPGFAQPPGLPPYPAVMGGAMTADAAARGADVLVVAGDLTAANLPDQAAGSRSLLDGFGNLALSGGLRRGDYVVARGNHDQPRAGAAYEACAPAGPDGRRDCLPAVYGLPHETLTVTEAGGLRLIGLDTTTPGTPGGAIGGGQFDALEQVLAGDPGRPTLVFGHHPVTDQSAYTAVAGPGFCLDRADAARLQALYAAAPGVFLHHSGHTHRNLRTTSPAAPGVDFLEVAAIKEYPGGFTLLRVHQGGYMANFYKSSSAPARQWSQATSGEYLGLYPAYALGALADRSHVAARDFSALTPLPR
jgi:3',5'-cyclic-AMP phosphodiesterase